MNDRYQIHTGDVLEVLRGMPSNHFDALLSDPPYGINFMGKQWDNGVPSPDVWREVLRVLKPGAPLLAFGGTRMYHRLVCAIEDAGFEIRDQLDWMYGSGFPKSMDLSKAIDKSAGAEREVIGEKLSPDGKPVSARRPNSSGKYDKTNAHNALSGETYHDNWITAPSTEAAQHWNGYGTALKPAHEPICLAMAPLDGTYAENVAKWGVGGLAIDASRIDYASPEDQAAMSAGVEAIRARGGVVEGSWKNSSDRSGANPASALGRWPANVILDEEAAQALDAQSGERPGMSGGGQHRADYAGGMFGGIDSTGTARGDAGGASRFFYVVKASRFEREFGCEHLALRAANDVVDREEGSAGINSPSAGAGRTSGARNHHPTVKPIDLARYLAAMMLPPPRQGGTRRLLIPFSGSGSEIIGSLRAGWDHVTGIEREADYVTIAHARIVRWLEVPADVDPNEVKPAPVDERQVSLFGGARK